MRVVVQRVRAAWVEVSGEEVARIGPGLLLLVGVARGDGLREASRAAAKIARLRLFPGDAHAMDRDVGAVGGAVLSVSQFTLLGDVSRGRRPSWAGAAPASAAAAVWEAFNQAVEACGVPVARGRFQADMDVHLVNWGPVTVVVDEPGPRAVDAAPPG